jgi:alpha-tubulin suppressor-like RCC1 family protein
VAGGAVKCWGQNFFDQLGDGTTTDSLTPVTVSGLTGATTIDSRLYHTCVLVAGGAGECWGHNDNGQLGDGTTTDSSTPVAVL